MAFFRKKSARVAVTKHIDVPKGFRLPAKTQWACQPTLLGGGSQRDISGQVLTGTELGPLVTLHHDAQDAHIRIRPAVGKSNGIDMTFDAFPGTFCSLAFNVPDDGVHDLARNNLLRLSLNATADVPFAAYARLNLVYGPNSEQIVRTIQLGDGDSFAEFDIFYTEFNPKRASNAWIDLIINSPQNRSIQISDISILRRIRASL